MTAPPPASQSGTEPHSISTRAPYYPTEEVHPNYLNPSPLSDVIRCHDGARRGSGRRGATARLLPPDPPTANRSKGWTFALQMRCGASTACTWPLNLHLRLHGMTILVDHLIEHGRSPTPRALLEPVRRLIDLDRDRRRDLAATQISPVGRRTVGLISKHPVRATPRPTGTEATHLDPVKDRDELRAVTTMPGGQDHRQRAAALLTGQVDLRGPPAPRLAQPVIGGSSPGGSTC
jgi:hypothetical protein